MNARRVPAGLQDTLMSGVNALFAETPVCLPSVKVSSQPATTSQAPAPAPDHPGGHGAKGHGPGDGGHGHGHGHGHGGNH